MRKNKPYGNHFRFRYLPLLPKNCCTSFVTHTKKCDKTLPFQFRTHSMTSGLTKISPVKPVRKNVFFHLFPILILGLIHVFVFFLLLLILLFCFLVLVLLYNFFTMAFRSYFFVAYMIRAAPNTKSKSKNCSSTESPSNTLRTGWLFFLLKILHSIEKQNVIELRGTSRQIFNPRIILRLLR